MSRPFINGSSSRWSRTWPPRSTITWDRSRTTSQYIVTRSDGVTLGVGIMDDFGNLKWAVEPSCVWLLDGRDP